MTTFEFIKNNYQVDGRTKYFASVMRDTAGNIYSYGTHYPLAFKLGDLHIVNCRNVSSTTRRHTSWAMSALKDYKKIVINVDPDLNGIINTALSTGQQDIIKKALYLLEISVSAQVVKLHGRMEDKKRKDTQVYASMKSDLDYLMYAVEQLRKAQV